MGLGVDMMLSSDPSGNARESTGLANASFNVGMNSTKLFAIELVSI